MIAKKENNCREKSAITRLNTINEPVLSRCGTNTFDFHFILNWDQCLSLRLIQSSLKGGWIAIACYFLPRCKIIFVLGIIISDYVIFWVKSSQRGNLVSQNCARDTKLINFLSTLWISNSKMYHFVSYKILIYAYNTCYLELLE